MEDFNEDDEVWSNPVTEQVVTVRGNVVCDYDKILRLWVTLSLKICVKWLQVSSAWLFISISITIMYLLIHILFYRCNINTVIVK